MRDFVEVAQQISDFARAHNEDLANDFDELRQDSWYKPPEMMQDMWLRGAHCLYHHFGDCYDELEPWQVEVSVIYNPNFKECVKKIREDCNAVLWQYYGE